MREEFKESIAMLPHCGNCGHLFRLDEVAIVEDIYHSLHACVKTETVIPCMCPKCKQPLNRLIMYSPDYFMKNGEFYSTND